MLNIKTKSSGLSCHKGFATFQEHLNGIYEARVEETLNDLGEQPISMPAPSSSLTHVNETFSLIQGRKKRFAVTAGVVIAGIIITAFSMGAIALSSGKMQIYLG